MRLIEGYIFAKVARAFLLSLVALATTVWLTQALREFDLVAAMGQTLLTFFQVTLLLLPALTTIVAPVALMIGVIYAFTNLNDGSELAVINAAGAKQWMLLKPVLLVAVLTSVFMASMTLYFSPLSLRLWRDLITDVRGNVLTSVVREGEFLKLTRGLTFQLRERMPDGTLAGIFLSDSREPRETVSYIAERGAVFDNPLGAFLVMNDGTIQRRNNKTKAISIIQFSSYAFDLSTFSSRNEVPSYRPAEQPTSFLINPDPDDRRYQRFPEQYRAELHSRLTTPLNALVFAILPLAFLTQAETTRQGRVATITLAVCAAVGIAVAEFLVSGAADTSLLGVTVLYALPVLAILASVGLILAGVQLKPPERLVAFGEAVATRLTTMLRSAELPAAAGGG